MHERGRKASKIPHPLCLWGLWLPSQRPDMIASEREIPSSGHPLNLLTVLLSTPAPLTKPHVATLVSSAWYS